LINVVQTSTKQGYKKVESTAYALHGTRNSVFISIGVGLWLGSKVDDYFSIKTPVFIWVLPLLIVVSSLIKIIIDTNRKNK